jgi:hypothetical protein
MLVQKTAQENSPSKKDGAYQQHTGCSWTMLWNVLKTLSAETLAGEIKKQADRLAFLTVGAERYAGGSYKLLRYSLEELFFPGEKDRKIKELRGKIDTELGNELKVPLRQIVLGWLVRNGYPDLAEEIEKREGKRNAGETKPELPQEAEEVATASKAIEAIDEISERAAYFQKMEDRSKAEAEKQSSPEEKALWLGQAEDMRKEKECLMNRLKAKEISN